MLARIFALGRNKESSFAADLQLIGEAIIDAFRAMVPSAVESRGSRLRHSGVSF